MGYSLLLLPNPLPRRTAADSLAMGWGVLIRCRWNNKDALWHAAFSPFSSFFMFGSIALTGAERVHLTLLLLWTEESVGIFAQFVKLMM
jgi:hypothetical protein